MIGYGELKKSEESETSIGRDITQLDEHYKNTVQPIEYIMANELPFSEGNVVKYVSRHRDKGGYDDLRKAMQYLMFIIDKEYHVSKQDLFDQLRELDWERFSDSKREL